MAAVFMLVSISWASFRFLVMLVSWKILVSTALVGIHWNALTERSQMNTHVPGFQSFCIGKISHQQHKG